MPEPPFGPSGSEPALPDASNFLSSRWSLDSVLCPYPPQVYCGAVQQRVSVEQLEQILAVLASRWGAFEASDIRQGVFAYHLLCDAADGPFEVRVPLAVDEPGSGGRTKQALPQIHERLARHFSEAGLGRLLVPVEDCVTLPGGLPVLRLARQPSEHALTFGRGGLQLNVSDAEEGWVFRLSPSKTAQVLTQVVATISYFYDPLRDDGTTLGDFYFNDGDFVLQRQPDGRLSVRLRALRRLQSGVGPDLLLSHLVQLIAYEDFCIDQKVTALPALMSDPSIAFHGFVTGLRMRALDLGEDPQGAESFARDCIDSFSRGRLGHCYRPFAQRFLSGSLPARFGHDLRHRFWRLLPLEERRTWLELHEGESGHSGELVACKRLLSALQTNIGKTQQVAEDCLFVNECQRDELRERLHAVGCLDHQGDSFGEVWSRLLKHYPYRRAQQFWDQVDPLGYLSRSGLRIDLGSPLSESEEGTPASLEAERLQARPKREIADGQLFSTHRLVSESEQAAAAQCFPSFEVFMDAALFDRDFGFYAKNVQIGRHGHFMTHPERFSPDYGRWIALLAYRAWLTMVRAGTLSPSAPFPLIEFGAGTGRLARDILDALAHGFQGAPKGLVEFASVVEYRIYEQSESLRAQQRELLAGDAQVIAGDARRPGCDLARDFPAGVSGFLLSNELLDAFGAHKVVLSPGARPRVALVVPRVDHALIAQLDPAVRRLVERSDQTLRTLFACCSRQSCSYLDQSSLCSFLRSAHQLPEPQQDALLAALFCEETYIDAHHFPQVEAHWARNRSDYEEAISALSSGVAVYVNAHADRFITEVAQHLRQGYVLTIDYGDTTQGLIAGAARGDFPFRVYRDSPQGLPTPNDPYAFVGTVDLTADVNFSAVARAAEEAGLRTLHYGPERELAREEWPDLRQKAHDHGVRAFLSAPVFKFLLLGSQDAQCVLPISGNGQGPPS